MDENGWSRLHYFFLDAAENNSSIKERWGVTNNITYSPENLSQGKIRKFKNEKNIPKKKQPISNFGLSNVPDFGKIGDPQKYFSAKCAKSRGQHNPIFRNRPKKQKCSTQVLGEGPKMRFGLCQI